jgi:hypothetical protein
MSFHRGHIVILSTCLLCGCLEGATGPVESPNVGGTYTDSTGIVIRLGADSLLGPAQLQLSQNPNSAEVTGDIIYSPIEDIEIVSGEIKSPMLVLTTRTEETDANDCHLYTQEWELRIQLPDLKVATVRGTVCEGDGQGGHVALRDITGGDGVYVRR